MVSHTSDLPLGHLQILFVVDYLKMVQFSDSFAKFTLSSLIFIFKATHEKFEISCTEVIIKKLKLSKLVVGNDRMKFKIM